jgi:malate dehydrogenase (oxaloacetate-decarboxylating)
MQNDIYKKSLELHKENGGKLETKSKIKLDSKEVLSLAYSPGVAEVSKIIASNTELAKKYTLKKNTVAIITDGSAILGLGDLGPLPAIPVMEGKACIFKEFAGVDAFPICLDTKDTEEIIKTIKNIAPVFGGINLEDISAPRCFEIEERLRNELDIPVMHDDQWGASTVILSALINSLKLIDEDFRNKKENFKIVINGVGAAGVATGKLLNKYGFTNIIYCDSKGIIHSNRVDLNKEKIELLENSKTETKEGKLEDAIVDAQVFIGLSKPNTLTKDMIKTMKEHPIIFALANPIPEIMPEEAISAGAYIVATGRSDYPNQINNSLVFPGIFKGMLENNIPQFKIEMFLEIAETLASMTENPNPEKIIPSMFDKNVVENVANTIAKFK